MSIKIRSKPNNYARFNPHVDDGQIFGEVWVVVNFTTENLHDVIAAELRTNDEEPKFNQKVIAERAKYWLNLYGRVGLSEHWQKGLKPAARETLAARAEEIGKDVMPELYGLPPKPKAAPKPKTDAKPDSAEPTTEGTPTTEETPDISKMSKKQLLKYATENGIEVRKNWNVAKLREELQTAPATE